MKVAGGTRGQSHAVSTELCHHSSDSTIWTHFKVINGCFMHLSNCKCNHVKSSSALAKRDKVGLVLKPESSSFQNK